MYPCPQPQVCGVRQHRNPGSCLGVPRVTDNRGARVASSLPLPPSSFLNKEKREDEMQERREFIESGGKIEITWHSDTNQIKTERWLVGGRPHREGGPASTLYYTDGVVAREMWFHDGVLHREDEPADARYFPSGDRHVQIWVVGDKLHRDGGPAVVERDPTTQIVHTAWYSEGVLHREDGPAEQFWQNEIVEKRWYIQGMECISENEFQERLDQWHTILSCLESGMTREMAEAWVGWS